jgi:hypothetical protein
MQKTLLDLARLPSLPDSISLAELWARWQANLPNQREECVKFYIKHSSHMPANDDDFAKLWLEFARSLTAEREAEMYDLAFKHKIGWKAPDYVRWITDQADYYAKYQMDLRMCDKILREARKMHEAGFRTT